jgi:Conserved phage C-terminus (Phg_2220_C).
MKRNTEIKLKVVEWNPESNLVILQTPTTTFTLQTSEFLSFIDSASPVKEKLPVKFNDISIKILKHLNFKSGRKFPTDNQANLAFIDARLRAGEDPNMLMKVIDYKCWQWKDDFKTKEWLRPQTLFNATKYQGYKQQVLDIEQNPQSFKEYVSKTEQSKSRVNEVNPLDRLFNSN